jgi:hypothetical protein
MRHLDGGLGVPDAGGGCLEDHGPVVVLLRTGAPAVEVKRMKRACLGCNRLCRHEKPGANLMITIFVAVIKFRRKNWQFSSKPMLLLLLTYDLLFCKTSCIMRK